ncbi:hypothetical protein SDC9_93466 [bioreactor metagenome]|uniref:Uncharacterized protein n=1 Tax=bioreactor metagenome TaxID=1076179 RepID=A0A645A0P6_9ZZZZ
MLDPSIDPRPSVKNLFEFKILALAVPYFGTAKERSVRLILRSMTRFVKSGGVYRQRSGPPLRSAERPPHLLTAERDETREAVRGERIMRDTGLAVSKANGAFCELRFIN